MTLNKTNMKIWILFSPTTTVYSQQRELVNPFVIETQASRIIFFQMILSHVYLELSHIFVNETNFKRLPTLS